MASFPQASPPTPCAPLYPPPICATCPAYLIRLDFTTRTILGKEYRSFNEVFTHMNFLAFAIICIFFIFATVYLFAASPLKEN
jgi:hypothetical protein